MRSRLLNRFVAVEVFCQRGVSSAAYNGRTLETGEGGREKWTRETRHSFTHSPVGGEGRNTR